MSQCYQNYCYIKLLLIIIVTIIIFIEQLSAQQEIVFQFKVASSEYSKKMGEHTSIIGTFIVCVDDSESLLTRVPVQLKVPVVQVTQQRKCKLMKTV